MGLIFFIIPAYNLNLLYTPEQLAEANDQNFYLSVARDLSTLPSVSIEDYQVTWSSFGVVYWVTTASRITGNTFGYVIFNIGLFLTILHVYIKVISQYSSVLRINLKRLLIAPYALLHISMPGKELFSICANLLAFSAIIFVLNRKYNLALLTITLSLAIAGISRPHEAAIIGVCILFALIASRFGYLRTFAILVISFTIINNLFIAEILNYFGINVFSLSDKIMYKSNFDIYFSSNSFLIHLLLSPLRIILLVGGFIIGPILNLIVVSWDGFMKFIFREVFSLLRIFDGIVIIYIFRQLLHYKYHHEIRSLITYCLVYFTFIVLAGIDQKARYIVGLIPLLAITSISINNKTTQIHR